MSIRQQRLYGDELNSKLEEMSKKYNISKIAYVRLVLVEHFQNKEKQKLILEQ